MEIFLDVKNCEKCGVSFWPRDKESLKQFYLRRFCGMDCRIAARKGSFESFEKKSCEFCRKELKPRSREQPSRFSVRRFCNRSCAIAKQTHKVAEKNCQHCGVVLIIKKGESSSNFKGRKYCSRSCVCLATHKIMRDDGRWVNLPPKKCRNCGDMFIRKYKETPFLFGKRACCSRDCANELKRHQSEEMFQMPVEEIYRRAAEIRSKRSYVCEEDREVFYEIPLVKLG